MASPHERASHELACRDPVMAELVERHGPMRLGARPPARRRLELVSRSIAYQQLNGRAASTIWGRARALLEGPWEPEAVLAVPEASWRGAGLSTAKAAAIADLARLVRDGEIDLHTIGWRGDDEVVAMLTRAKGIGQWTAQMFLLFQLQRLDVWPTGDHGVRAGFARAFGAGPELDSTPSPATLTVAGDRFRPYRSVVAWYCWRVMDTVVPDT